ncbi:hypothetical protein JR316_0012799 [Psilocybe cubensis]|uniref:Uncharacterized protein n=1 Tax=Psilocybe cubensis TaxID=181762 RepID=A0ACB8GGM6_PSICU|nr:hypothetical protein JR316_0012799 [Psilocybe cubensis]KAH9474341.1 hypothetical protein JR316_0012799 [Psilocybe cubensis]
MERDATNADDAPGQNDPNALASQHNGTVLTTPSEPAECAQQAHDARSDETDSKLQRVCSGNDWADDDDFALVLTRRMTRSMPTRGLPRRQPESPAVHASLTSLSSEDTVLTVAVTSLEALQTQGTRSE